MAIDITCYTKLDKEFLNKKINKIKTKYNNIFDRSYVIYLALPVLEREQLELISDEQKRYSQESKLLIAEEFGLKGARSYFMVSVNDKSFPEMNTSEIADLLRSELGNENIIVLLNGEELI
ncbi:hypothetical protein A9G42_03080 [Gilliamella sp. Nev6-6]|jgi:hypothetical protein|uniref:hypothetical protein n=1 Tax=Gilliamella sp. Nev6-6 TaxID=3120252 RepID=UPI00080F47FF|nr:hypothetical protein [Gilliamella apicola]OCG78412.1 hypothetical protein A9G42_03080 [Gilliamella apicola]